MAVSGQRLCAGCREELAAGLRVLPWLYLECEHVLGGGPTPTRLEKTTGGALPGMPFNGAAAEARSEIVKALSSWCGLVADERHVSGPPRAVEPLAAFLARHIDWLCAHPAAVEATAEVAGLVRTARRVVHTEPVRTVRIGACVIPGCGGELGAVVPVRTPARPVGVQCTEDVGHTWAGHQWTQLSRTLEERASDHGTGSREERWLTAADISRLWSTPVGTVYRLASEQRWRRRNQAGRTHYNESDVHECFSRRAARSSR
ncbi:hypothetical protein ABZT34_28555 [Streptomyces sp. NPDC005329]|uniref:hypothetical protein n=1 Tax=Streptomyces sp. NPDC005329 TaxID=3157034 RepID=UPI0033A0DE9A